MNRGNIRTVVPVHFARVLRHLDFEAQSAYKMA